MDKREVIRLALNEEGYPEAFEMLCEDTVTYLDNLEDESFLDMEEFISYIGTSERLAKAILSYVRENR